MLGFGVAEVIFLILAIASAIDLISRRVPSFLLTTAMFISLAVVIFIGNSTMIMTSISLGILGYMFGMILYDLNYIGGMADLKVIIVMSLVLVDLSAFFTMMILIVVFGAVYKLLIWRWILKKGDDDEIPFLVCLFAVYVALYMLGGII
jgi:hypothetical protein